jgi:cytochrome c2
MPTAKTPRSSPALRHALVAAVLLSSVTLVHAHADENFQNAKRMIRSYGCGSCHEIPGVEGATGQVGPPLAGMGNRVFIAGMLENSRSNMVRWISNPQSVVPGNAMPNMNIPPAEADEIASYLETLRERSSR